MEASKVLLPSQQVDVAWLSQVELLDADSYPLPGGSLCRGAGGVDLRLSLTGAKSTDTITMFEDVASVRHKPTLQIYVAFRETMDALLKRQQDPDKFPAWLMKHPVKKTEMHVQILRAKCNQGTGHAGNRPADHQDDRQGSAANQCQTYPDRPAAAEPQSSWLIRCGSPACAIRCWPRSGGGT